MSTPCVLVHTCTSQCKLLHPHRDCCHCGVLLLLVAVTGVVVLLLVIFRRKHVNKEGNLQ